MNTMWMRLAAVNAALLVGAAVPLSVGGQEPSVPPQINQQYRDPEFERWVRIFERPGREVYDERHEIVAAVGLETGMDVADVGAGTGLFTRLFSAEVGSRGTVYAVDISEEFIRNIERIAEEQDLTNVKGVVNDQHGVSLPDDSIDLAFVCATYHHFEHPQAMLSSIRRALRPDGRLIVIDFRKNPEVSSDWVMNHVRAGQETVVEEIVASGFRLKRERALLSANYFLEFEKAKAE